MTLNLNTALVYLYFTLIFLFMLLYTFRGKYCTFYSSTFHSYSYLSQKPIITL